MIMIGRIIDVLVWALICAGGIALAVAFIGIVIVVLLSGWRDDDDS